ncbi:DUF2061 domain-containing protein [Teredinibacter sp. KSP-S5-2]|uniref:DUF2061 domain-containing protein n=1 Tax=Teredinibacter sp. KSP-S5-2 TaxID=3034506 RepID=UPI0029345554|nr:DUF2061 domain-containing protein [Teredinibacter sp. KSP-S5-2]WNO09185.1 DUF2061 domain-containing protein [Teredinibacter sp. KSP-S5-2]
MVKTLSFASLHFSIAFIVTWVLTGDVLVGGLVALVEPAINSVAYFFHEKAWNSAKKSQTSTDFGRLQNA